jgi:adenosylcobinamide-GDP ribazoletransferase
MIRALFSAIAFLTVIPVPEALKSRTPNGMFAGYPIAGILIGALFSVVFWAAGLVFPAAVTAVILIACSLLLTGAIHLDGLADCGDAFYGRRDKETTLRILKDPRIGTMGGAAIGLSLLARYASLVSLPAHLALLSLPIMAMFSRSAVVVAMRLLPYVRSDSGILTARSSTGRGALAFSLVALAASLVLLPVPTVAALLVLGLFWRLSWKRIGGCTGDVLGATIEIGEIVCLVALAAVGSHGALGWPGLLSSVASGSPWLSPAAGR